MSEKAVSAKWSAKEPDMTRHFHGFPYFSKYLIENAWGTEVAEKYVDSPVTPVIAIFRDLYVKGRPIKNVLSLCCGFGRVERRFLKAFPEIESCLGVDIAKGALEIAKQRAKEEGMDDRLEYRYADLNTFEWGEDRYDLVIAQGALHHLSNLEQVITGVYQSLRPGGFLYSTEHVGANHQDYPNRQLELMNAVAYLVPPELRSRVGTPFSHFNRTSWVLNKAYQLYKGQLALDDPKDRPDWSFPKKLAATGLRSLSLGKPKNGETPFHFGIIHDNQKQYLLRIDPSEGVRASEIIPILKKTFPNVDVRNQGGALLCYALDGKFFDNFDPENEAHRKLVDLLFQVERTMMENGDIKMEYAYIFAEKQ